MGTDMEINAPLAARDVAGRLGSGISQHAKDHRGNHAATFTTINQARPFSLRDEMMR